MRASHDRRLLEGREVKVPDVEGLTVGELHIELLVEVAIKDAALPVDADGVAAHEGADGGRVEALDEKLVIFGELLVTLQVGSVARDGHIGDAEEFVELDVEVLLHLAFVFHLEFFLRRGEEGAVRVVDEVELKLGIDAVAEFIKLLERGDGTFENVVTTLLVDVFRGVARHGGDAGDLMLGVELRDPLVAGLLDDGGVEPSHHFARLVKVAHAFDEFAEVGVHFGGAASEVEDGDVGLFEPVDGFVEVLSGDEFFAVRSGVHVAVHTGNVAKLAEVQLKNAWSGASEGNSVFGEFAVEGVLRCNGSGAHEKVGE